MKIHDYTNPFRSRFYITKPSGSYGGLNRKNPFRGIACGSPRNPSMERHIEGARDTDRALRMNQENVTFGVPFRMNNPIPCVFLP
jgi:hypothetical protein